MTVHEKCFLRISFYLLALTIFQKSFGQENYLPGYIIPQHGDTIHGFIDYRNWERNPNVISFKKELSVNKKIYSPLTIKTFGVLDETYESAIVETETSPVDTKELNYEKELTYKLDTTFLQAIIKGVKSLYFYKNKLGKEQFYIMQDSAYKLLIFKRYLKDIEGKAVIAENKRFIGQLLLYLADCSTIQNKINRAEYRKNSLENLFLHYYECTHTNVSFHKQTEKTKTEFGLLAGASLTTLKFGGDFIYLVNTDYPQSASFSGGVFFDVILSRNQKKWSICNEVIINSYQTNGRFYNYENADKQTTVYTTFGYTYLKMNNMLRFKYPIGRVYIYFNGGITNGYAISEKNYARTETTLFDQVSVEESKAINETKRYELGYVIGIGTKYKKYSFEARFERGNGMSVYMRLKSSTYRFYGLFAYRF